MTNLERFINEKTVEFSKNPVNSDFIPVLEKEFGVSFGEQLRKYILEYGYLSYKFVELYGITNNQKFASDMVKKTKYLHANFDCTHGFVVLEDAGDADFLLIDDQDNIFEFIPELGNHIKQTNQKLFDYIYERFNALS